MSEHRTIVKRPVLSGASRRITLWLVDEDDQPIADSDLDSVTMSIYDVSYTPVGSSVMTTLPPFGSTPLASAFVNSRDDVDVLSSVNSEGRLRLRLTEDDTAVSVPAGSVPSVATRIVAFRWTWDTDGVGKHEIVLTIAPDRETVAS